MFKMQKKILHSPKIIQKYTWRTLIQKIKILFQEKYPRMANTSIADDISATYKLF